MDAPASLPGETVVAHVAEELLPAPSGDRSDNGPLSSQEAVSLDTSALPPVPCGDDHNEDDRDDPTDANCEQQQVERENIVHDYVVKQNIANIADLHEIFAHVNFDYLVKAYKQ